MPKKTFSPTPSANGDGRKLTRRFITQRAEALRVRQLDEVAVTAFGDDMTVNVKGMTVADKNLLNQMQERGHDAMSIVAALCAVDDDGRLVFGDTKAEAVATVEELPEQYRADVAAIALAAMRLSGHAQSVNDDETAVEDAEKN